MYTATPHCNIDTLIKSLEKKRKGTNSSCVGQLRVFVSNRRICRTGVAKKCRSVADDLLIADNDRDTQRLANKRRVGQDYASYPEWRERRSKSVARKAMHAN